MGNDAVWALSGGRLHRLDPDDNSVAPAGLPLRVRQIAVGPGSLWAVSVDRIVNLDPVSMAILRTYFVPAGTEIRDDVFWRRPQPGEGASTEYVPDPLITLTVLRPQRLDCHPSCPKKLPGRIDPRSNRIVLPEH